jgi:hypothetical protein
MRIATFVTPGGHTCTLSAFPGDVGGLEANVRRWLGQLGVASPAEATLASFLGEVESLATEAGAAGSFLDFRAWEGLEAEAMLAALLEKEGFTVFLKLTAPPADLTAEEERFRALFRSLR